ncbi:proline--tRNA ligase [Ferrimicrobium sp.]|uniref:proline--tRNA ligase n=1 Tax=Ferrimicrobium sp. TaxID=2926050 RepID=UPI00262F4BEB|nr:proline--tRNA ligase [Ferrimicrobium sp.]
MRTSELVFRSRREVPQDAEAASHKVLIRGNYIRRLTSGVYSFLPLGFRVLRNVERIVEEELDRAGASQLLLPALQPVDIWRATGRIDKMADVLFRVDGKSGAFVLGPTHEEAVIEAMSPDIESYRDLPKLVYQIQTKFRDEPRARFGLMRTREFIMADGYSFDVDRDAMRDSYRRFYDAYLAIFARLGLRAEPVEADAGSIGGDVNHEFMVASSIGEDHFAHCSDCGYQANIEAARAGERPSVEVDPEGQPVTYATPNAPGIEIAVKALRDLGAEVEVASMLKSMLLIDDLGDRVIALLPGDRTLNVPRGMRLATDAEMTGFAKGYIGPQGHGSEVRVIADPLVRTRPSWASGANEVGHHCVGLRVGVDFQVDQFVDLVVVEDGDPCPRCGGVLSLIRSVEVGHTFQLGLTYSGVLSHARYRSVDGEELPYWMGCYGIGVTRVPAVIAQQYGSVDGDAVVWPIEVAPYVVSIVGVGATKTNEVATVAEQLHESMVQSGIAALLEDRSISTGVAMRDLELIGSPLFCIVGARSLAKGVVELRDRIREQTVEVPIDEVTATILSLTRALASERR